MVELSIERINECSPYTVFSAGSGAWSFMTDYGITLSVAFPVEDTFLDGIEAYQFALNNMSFRPSPKDPKVQATITAILSEFFRANSSALLYLCDSVGGQQAARARLFRLWFDSTLFNHEIHREDAEIKEEDGEVNYVSMLIRKDSPFCEIAVREFREQVELFNKP